MGEAFRHSIYESELRRNEYTDVTKLVILKTRMELYPHLFDEQSIRQLRLLDEYLKCNLENTSDMVFNCQYRINNIPIYFFEHENEDPHALVVNGNDINYSLRDTTNLKTAKDEDIGIVSFSVKTGERINAYKTYIHNGKLFVERYYTRDGIILVRAYDIDKVYNPEIKDLYEFKPESAFNQIQWLTGCEPEFSISITEQFPNKMNVSVSKNNDEHETEIIEGDSLYSAYYDYMVEKGYFVNNSNKQKKI